MPPPAFDILWALDPTSRRGEGGRELLCSLCNHGVVQKEVLLERRRAREGDQIEGSLLFSRNWDMKSTGGQCWAGGGASQVGRGTGKSWFWSFLPLLPEWCVSGTGPGRGDLGPRGCFPH